ncbi:MAG: riboflavin biosynthesis protein RibF [Flavobacteriales bacterium]
MKTYPQTAQFAGVARPVLTTGTFDGVHLGHRRILDRLVELSEQVEGETAMLTFFPHPRMVLHPEDHGLQLLTTPSEKSALLAEAGIKHLIVQPFTPELARMTATHYIRDLLVREIGVHTMVVGYDHHFGRNREGDFDNLVEFSEVYGFNVEEIPAWQIDEVSVSSTKIREALLAGDVATAERYLGYRYGLDGTVVPGQQLGQQLGAPTANMQPEFNWKLVPGNGVYAAHVVVDGQEHPAVVNIGNRPTLGDGLERTIEAHLLHFEGNLYQRNVRLVMGAFLRGERKFSDAEALKEQISQDVRHAHAYFEG